MEEYPAEISAMDPPDFIEFLASELEKNVGLTKEDALYDAESMVNAKRLVKDGQYALLELDSPGTLSGDSSEPTFHYYKRVDDQWIKDDSIDNSIFTEKSKLFCNIFIF
mgnify:FL=1